MLVKLDKLLDKNQINQFIIINFFFIFLTFVLSKGFIKDEEVSDKIFLISSVILIEIIYLFTTNNLISFNLSSFKDNFLLFFIFIFNYLIWNSEAIISYTEIFSFICFQLILAYLIKIYFDGKLFIKNNKSEFENFLLFGILSFFYGGLFYDLNYSSYIQYLIILFFLIITLSISKIFTKIHKYFDIFTSSLIFIIFFKVFILSSTKDSFHYSWFLGPINSLSKNYNLLDNVASQYGFLNILLINKISQLTNFESSYVLVTTIAIFFIIFFYIFFIEILKIIKLPYIIIVTFLSLLIFGNSGYANLSGGMFIPSSSVFRFLPSLIFVLFFSKFIEKKISLNQTLLIYIIFIFNLLWSFESAFFVCFSLITFFFFKNLITFKVTEFKKTLITFLNYKYLILVCILIIFFLLLKDKNYFLFYEHALNSNASLAEEIKNNRVTLSYIFTLFLSYIILRDSFINKSSFYYNILWFSLFVAYSLYFLVRSVDNNFFNIFPFLIFIICLMRTNSNYISDLRKKSIIVIIFFLIIFSFNTIRINHEKFFNTLLSKNVLVTPNYLSENYQPNIKVQNEINKFENIPLTLISGKFIHKPNSNLFSNGYGLPILPLEHFNILNLKVKKKLMVSFFKINKSHLILCTINCEFYGSDKDYNYYNKIFLGDDINAELLINYNDTEYLYLLKKK